MVRSRLLRPARLSRRAGLGDSRGDESRPMLKGARAGLASGEVCVAWAAAPPPD